MNYGSIREVQGRDKKPIVIRNRNVYKVARKKNFISLCQKLYPARGLSLKGYRAAHLGNAAVSEYFFPYEKFTAYDLLDEPVSTLTAGGFCFKTRGTLNLEERRTKRSAGSVGIFCEET